MYRCFACDSPAMMNCECHTQVELPTDQTEQNAIANGIEDFHARRQGEHHKRINIASGEDVGYWTEVA